MEKEKKSIIGRFKELPTKKKVIVVLVAIVVIMFLLGMIGGSSDNSSVSTSTGTSKSSSSKLTEKSNNVNGMRFTFTVSDYVENYNAVIRETEDMPELFEIEKSDFELLQTKDGIKTYSYNRLVGNQQVRFAIGLYVEEESNKVIEVSFMTENAYMKKLTEEQKTYLMTHNMAQVIMATNKGLTMESAFELTKKAANSTPTVYYNSKDNTITAVSMNNQVTTFKVGAMSKDVYNKNFK